MTILSIPHRWIASCGSWAAALSLVLATTALVGDEPSNQPNAVKKVHDEKTLKFDQERASANMRELEDRMIKLGEMLREAEPEDSARLLLGVQKARDQLILEQMQAVTRLIDELDLDRANKEQREVLEKLERLKELLLSTDLDLQLKLEQLRKIRAARKKLADLIAKEEEQHNQTQAAAEAKEAKPSDAKALQQSENRNQKAGEQLKRQVGDIQKGEAAAKSVGGACQSMGKASQSLGQGNCQGACPAQQEALEQLRKADQELAKLEEEVKLKAESAARRRVMELIAGMIDREEKIKEATVGIVAKGLTDPARLKRLADAQDRVTLMATECIDICDTTEFSYALPVAMRSIRIRCEEIKVYFEIESLDQDLVDLEQTVIDDLHELLAAMKQGAKPTRQTNSQCKGGCCSNKNKLLAEVKMLLWMQKAGFARNETNS